MILTLMRLYKLISIHDINVSFPLLSVVPLPTTYSLYTCVWTYFTTQVLVSHLSSVTLVFRTTGTRCSYEPYKPPLGPPEQTLLFQSIIL